MGGGFLYTTGAEAENSAVKFSKESVPPLYKTGLPFQTSATTLKILHVGPHQFRESLQELLRELWFSYCSSHEMPFREWNFAFQESVSEFRELLRE